jgi:hypothetical protein
MKSANPTPVCQPTLVVPSPPVNAAAVPVFDAEYLGQQQERYKKVFPQWDIVGWYGTGQEVVPEAGLALCTRVILESKRQLMTAL